MIRRQATWVNAALLAPAPSYLLQANDCEAKRACWQDGIDAAKPNARARMSKSARDIISTLVKANWFDGICQCIHPEMTT